MLPHLVELVDVGELLGSWKAVQREWQLCAGAPGQSICVDRVPMYHMAEGRRTQVETQPFSGKKVFPGMNGALGVMS